MSRLVFDIETNGLLPQLTTIHCIAIRDLDECDRRVNSMKTYRPTEIEDALDRLECADEIIGHNVIGFDIPAIQKLFPDWKPRGKVTDTLVLSRLIKADLLTDDSMRVKHPEGFLKRFYGSHSLKAWGMRMGNLKGDYDGGWDTFNEDMLLYMVQDVNVTCDLLKLLCLDNDFSERCIELEHDLAEVCFRIGNNGWTFDGEKAAALYATLCQRRLDLEIDLATLFEPWEIRTPFTPKVNNKSRGYEKGVTVDKVVEVHFNPNSRQHIARCLIEKYKWKPKSFTPSGQPKIDEEVLIKLEYPEAKKLAEFFLVQKRIAMLSEGSAGWMKMVDSDGKIRHNLISCGTVSHRCSHRSPNLAQIPSTRSAYGQECRELFTVPKGWYLCGADLSGIELRCLAAMLNDNQEYAKQILEGDIHTHNQKAFGVATRDISKTLIYSVCYGAGDGLVGKVVGGTAKDGKAIKAAFNQNIPAFKNLNDELRRAFKNKGWIRGIDNRKLFVKSEHRVLSQILQNAGSVIAKSWVRIIDREITKNSLEAYIVGFVHDEIQIACKTKKVAEDVGNITRRASIESGQEHGFQIPIEAEFNIGKTWADTH